jgi:hypothetical protein
MKRKLNAMTADPLTEARWPPSGCDIVMTFA